MAKIHDVPATNTAGKWNTPDKTGKWDTPDEADTFLKDEETPSSSAPDYLEDDKSGWQSQVIIDITSVGQVQSLVWNSKTNETFKCAEGDENSSIHAMFG